MLLNQLVLVFTWIQRYRVRMMHADAALDGLIAFAIVIVVVFLFKWFMKSTDRRY